MARVGPLLTLISALWATNVGPTTKEELKRRVEFADQHFSEGSTPGSKTASGQLYVGLGPPDERKDFAQLQREWQLEPDPTGGLREGLMFPFERWTYRDIPGIGKDIKIEFIAEDFQIGTYDTLIESLV
ncbi:MAG TPA: GWxTD domain-containing protein [Acidobacteriota bacterium]|nr:GWxTD domain-containing protein [Acidobacteriota bacterium]